MAGGGEGNTCFSKTSRRTIEKDKRVSRNHNFLSAAGRENATEGRPGVTVLRYLDTGSGEANSSSVVASSNCKSAFRAATRSLDFNQTLVLRRMNSACFELHFPSLNVKNGRVFGAKRTVQTGAPLKTKYHSISTVATPVSFVYFGLNGSRRKRNGI